MNWEKLSRLSMDDIIVWAETQTWCHAMSGCVQDAEWHSEGDVWTHTKMVLDELTNLDDWPSLTKHEQTVLVFTTLFHDIAKPLTTEIDEETGRVKSPKHAVKGEHMARNILRQLDCELSTREEITQLVRYHGRPAFLLERTEPIHEVVRLSWLVNNRLLFLLALADTRGRDTDSMSRPEENLLYWKMLAEENNCFDSPYPFATDHARFTFFHQSSPSLSYIPHENFSCNVTLLAGIPGSGKDTWLAKNRPELPIVSLDDIRDELDVDPTDDQGQVAQYARERCKEYLRAKSSFAFNATNTMKQTRTRWLDLFTDYNARIEIAYVEPIFQKILRQNRSRSEAVPDSVIHKLASKCEPPTWLECHNLIISNGIDE